MGPGMAGGGAALLLLAGTVVACGVALQWLGRNWGATAEERRATMPGDRVVPHPHLMTTHAVSIDVPPHRVWPWIVQMGYHRGGWYTYPWVDRYLFHMSNPSAERIEPQLQGIAVGDIIPDSEPGTAWYVVEEVEPQRTLVLRSDTHLPPAWRANPHLGAWVRWTWAFVLHPAGGGTRLVVRARGACGPWWVRALAVGAIIPADFVMARSMLRGIKRRAETTRAVPGSRPMSATCRSGPGRPSACSRCPSEASSWQCSERSP